MGSAPKYRSLRGMPDMLPEQASAVRWVTQKSVDVFRAFGFSEIRTPLLEETEVFTRSIGEDTDIVEKEMYSFDDRGGKNISLRPEGTASIIRAYIEHGWGNTPELVKLYYAGPMFRGERPQKGRLRQFHQIGAEMIGAADPYIDADLINSLCAILKELGLDGFTILINSLGCSGDRERYKKALKEYLSGKTGQLCENCARRANTNVLRVLDCKSRGCRAVVGKAPAIVDSLCPDCLRYYEDLKRILSDMGIPYTEKKDLVRGLDYYTGTIFEVTHPALGAQDALAAGGRYDDLTRQMGGPDVGATGYAIGVERLLLALDVKNIPSDPTCVFVIPMDDAYRAEAFKTTGKLRQEGVPADMDLTGRSFKAQLRMANREARRFVVILGEEEAAAGKLTLKDMEGGEQKTVTLDEAVGILKRETVDGG